MNLYHEHFLKLKSYDDSINVLNKGDLEQELVVVLKDIDTNHAKEEQLNRERIELESSLKSIKGHLDTRVNAAMYENLHKEVSTLTEALATNAAAVDDISKLNKKLNSNKDDIEMKLSMYMNRYLHYAPLLDIFIERYNDMRNTVAGNNADGGKNMFISYICKKLKEYTGSGDSTNNYNDI